MNHPALKGEVSLDKMSRQISPRLRRSNVMLNSICSCISNASEEFSWTPEMSFSKILSQPGMFMQKFKGTVSFKQLESFANTHSWGQFNKEMDVVNSNMEFIDFTSMPDSNFEDKPLAINPNSIELKGIHSIFRLPDKVECILPEGMFKGLQIHFLSPKSAGDKAHANFCFISGAQQSLSHINVLRELNLATALLPSLKAGVSGPQDM